ncbi:hypothetical protein SteCoe_7747 [Stentor coeruleus]|uniref:Uncharacterized protein n=1 Tax=Stentor coeruleus TaxID=5963 RepID=A0A1R2CLU7_9CILI|nr:hypothetical protein SteCoe_7747 [Stentor coeruleus]
MDFEDIENKENLPPYLKSGMISTGSYNKKKTLTAAEKARVLKEKILEKHEMRFDKSYKISQMLPTPEDILSENKNTSILYPISLFQNHWYQKS